MKKKDTKKSSQGRLRQILLSPATSIVMFLVAAALLLISGIGGARAALTYFSQTLESQYGMYHIGVTLMEHSQEDEKDKYRDVSYRNYSGKADGVWEEKTGYLLDNMLAKDQPFVIGKTYEEKIRVRNSSGENTSNNPGINEFVRVTIYKYWMDKSPKDSSAKKLPKMDPSDIDLHLVNTSGDGAHWIIDERASTDERIVAYYSALLENGDETVDLTDALTVKNIAAKRVIRGRDKNNKMIVYDYDGKCFCIEATVDAVQQNNAAEAIPSAWGRNVQISGEGNNLTLSLVNVVN